MIHLARFAGKLLTGEQRVLSEICGKGFEVEVSGKGGKICAVMPC